MSYKQLTQAQRYQIHALLKAACDQTEIAMIVGCHKSTISREIRRNTGLRGYRPQQAQRLANERKHAKNQPRIADNTWLIVEQLLVLDWSWEQISLWLKAFCGIAISHEWIYQFILQDDANFYFAHPYASWECGLNENTNGLIRQYFPKNRDFTTITQKEINQTMSKLNNRPRKCLAMKTPNQVFLGINPPVALAS